MAKHRVSEPVSGALIPGEDAVAAVTSDLFADLNLDMAELEERLEMAAIPDCCCLCNGTDCHPK